MRTIIVPLVLVLVAATTACSATKRKRPPAPPSRSVRRRLLEPELGEADIELLEPGRRSTFCEYLGDILPRERYVDVAPLSPPVNAPVTPLVPRLN
jgi:hypothetical protein